MKKVRTVVQWVFVALFLICALMWCPSFSSIIFLVGAIVLLPIKPFEEFLEKIKLILSIRIVIAVILLVVGFSVTPDLAPASTEKETGQESASSSDDKKDNDNTDKKDNSKDNSKDDSKDDSKNNSKNTDESTGSANIRCDSTERSFGGKFTYHPVSEPPQLGNFKDIDKSVFAESSYEVKSVVGRWYEDGWLEGYYLELYGNGTWKYFGPVERCGTYTIQNALFYLDECEYGTDVAQLSIYYDEDWGAYATSFLNCGPEIILTRTPATGKPYFVMEDGCSHCEDLAAFYKEKYPFRDLAGSWDPVEEPDEYHFFILTAEGVWSYVEERGAAEVGVLEKPDSDGVYTSVGATWDTIRKFKISDDGYLYVDGLPYEKRAEDPHVPPQGTAGTYMYRDKDGGYTFYDDWTFESTQDSPFKERGSYIFIGDSLLLYDEDGYRIHAFYQSELMRTKFIHYITDYENDVYGENLSFVG
ncbi:MAG: hypothetical protein J6Y89_00730 [Lachnospiraceae bacterium]|nr:hypothetical protein [Lachnospiraceae bacterium]